MVRRERAFRKNERSKEELRREGVSVLIIQDRRMEMDDVNDLLSMFII
jgi:cell fate (sporulation/competence/biofilm development) regulator YmcA (YheA/YmcA/DUF963 family)